WGAPARLQGSAGMLLLKVLVNGVRGDRVWATHSGWPRPSVRLRSLDHRLAAAARRVLLAAARRRGALGHRQLAPAVLIGAAVDLSLTERHRSHLHFSRSDP